MNFQYIERAALHALLFLLAPSLVAADATKPEPSAAEKRLDALGELKDDLGFWIGMNALEHGGIEWARFEFQYKVNGNVAEGGEGGRKWFTFEKASFLKVEPALALDRRYTVCTWMLFPSPKKHGLIWQGPREGGGAIFSDDVELFGWNTSFGGQVKIASFPEPLKGWHHIAITTDEKTTRAFLDGKEIGSYDGIILRKIGSIGNHWSAPAATWMMCAGLDDQFIFCRPLSAEEIQKVMSFERPKIEAEK